MREGKGFTLTVATDEVRVDDGAPGLVGRRAVDVVSRYIIAHGLLRRNRG